ncbi:MAG: hypothetical protein ACRD6R_00985 [Candidatus Polarisedimenticolia bacterium]
MRLCRARRDRMRHASRFLLAASIAVALAGTVAHAQPPEDELIGLWAHGAHFGPMVQGEIVIGRTDGVWRATFAGLDATVEAKGEAVRAVFPQGVGSFRGTLAGNGRAIHGFWVRPGVSEDPRYPGGATQSFATPLLLTRSGPDRSRGEVHPLKVRFKLYLKIFRDEKGMLPGAFRDPYMNGIGGASRFRVTRDGGEAVFSLPNDEGGYDTVVEAALARAVQKILDGDPAARAPSLVHSILVARRGRLVLEEYFFGFDRETPHDLRSAGKTFASVMLGAAIMKGAGISPETSVYRLLADRGPFANPDPRWRRSCWRT